MEQTGQKKLLIQKINQVMKTAGNVPKSGMNEFHKYAYRKHEDIMAKLGPALIDAGLAMSQKSLVVLQGEIGHLTVAITYEITDGETALEFLGIGEGRDVSRDGKPGDKSAYKAQTGAFKYALNVLLAMGDQDDAEAHGDPAKPAAASRAQPAQAAARPATQATPPAAAPKAAADSPASASLYKKECGRIAEATSSQKLAFIFSDFTGFHKAGKLTDDQVTDLKDRYQAKDKQLKGSR